MKTTIEMFTQLHDRKNIGSAMLMFAHIAIMVIFLYGSVYGQTNSIEQTYLQIQEIDNSIRALETELVDVDLKIDAANQDSLRIILEHQKTLSELQGKIELVDQQISAKNTEITAEKTQRASVVNDSIRAVQAFAAERISIVTKIKQLESLVQSRKNEMTVLAQRRAQLHQFSLQQSDPKVIQLQSEKQSVDNSLVTKQKKLDSLNFRKTELTNDSIAQMIQVQASVSEENRVLAETEGEVQAAEVSVSSARNSLNQALSLHNEKKSRINNQVQQLLSRKASLATATSQSMTRLGKMEVDLSKLAVSAGTLQKKYEEGRTPIVTQLDAINQVLQTREQQQIIWKQMKEKYVIDSLIIVARNEFDGLIQESAGGKRSAKKLIDEKETELNALLGKRDTYMSMPGVKQMDNQLATLTHSQQRARIEQVLSNINEDFTKQTTLKIQTESDLQQYDIQNPIASNPSMLKYRQIDSLARLEKINKEMLRAQVDSVDIVVKSYRDTIAMLDASAKNEMSLYENELNASIAQKNNITATRDQMKRGALDTKVKNGMQLTAIVNESKSVNMKISTLEREIAAAQNQSNEMASRLTALQQQFEAMKASSLQEIGSLDTQIADKENEIAELLKQNNQHEEQIRSSETALKEKVTSASQNSQILAQQISTSNGDMFHLSEQRKALMAEVEVAHKKKNSELLSLRSVSVGLNKRSEIIKTEISRLRSKRTVTVSGIQDKIGSTRKSINLIQSEIDKYSGAYSTAVQDSIAFEKTRVNAYYEVKTVIDRQDSVLSAVLIQQQSAVAEYEKARTDSVATVHAALSAVEPSIRNIQSIDSAITVKQRELASLREQRLQAVQDSMTKISSVKNTMVQAHTVIRQKSNVVASLELQSAVQLKEKKRLESDAVTKGEQFKNSRAAWAAKLSDYLSKISYNKQSFEQLNNELLTAEDTFTKIDNTHQNSIQQTSGEVIRNSGDAQAVVEKIYNLMGENKMDEARSLFISNKQVLQKYTSPDVIEMLQTSF